MMGTLEANMILVYSALCFSSTLPVIPTCDILKLSFVFLRYTLLKKNSTQRRPVHKKLNTLQIIRTAFYRRIKHSEKDLHF